MMDVRLIADRVRDIASDFGQQQAERQRRRALDRADFAWLGEAGFLLTGVSHFGSGAGIMSYMMTSAVPTGETEPDDFFLDLQGIPWDGSAGVKLLAEWDGHGMIATQSHTFGFADYPATRFAWPKSSRR